MSFIKLTTLLVVAAAFGLWLGHQVSSAMQNLVLTNATSQQCQEVSEVLSMMTASEAHSNLVAKARDMGCNEQDYPIGVLVGGK